MIELKGTKTNAKIFTDNVEELAIEQVKNMINHEITEGTQVRLMPDCLSYNTEILTTEGFKFIRNVDLKDVVASYDNETSNILWEHPENVIVRDLRNDEKIFKLKNKQHNIEIITTENHRNAITNNMGIKTKDLSNVIKIKDLVWNANVKSKGLDISDNLLRFIAWVVADGNIKTTKNQRSINYRIRIGAKKQRKIDVIKKLIDELSLTYSERICQLKGTTFTINTSSSKPILEIMNYKKEFPLEWIKTINKRQIDILINEYVLSDGDYETFKKTGSIGLSSSNKNIVDFFSAISVLSFGASYTRKIISGAKSFKPGVISYYISIIPNERLNHSKSGYPNKSLTKEEIEYVEKVVCVTVKSGFFVARQGGRTFITGNCHAGKGSTIGTTIALPENFKDWKVSPNVVGVDVGCGILMYKISNKDIDLAKLDKTINKSIPSGFDTHNHIQDEQYTQGVINALSFDVPDKIANRIHRSLGTLGGGNHFIELGKDEDGDYWLSVHSGSRNLGVQVAETHQNKAIELLRTKEKENEIDIKAVIEALKSNGRHSEIEETIKVLKETKKEIQITKEDEMLAYLTGELLRKYMEDMTTAQRYAIKSRETMLNIISEAMEFEVIDKFDSAHNFIDHDDYSNGVVRKGATSAKMGERLVIPLNMRDGSLICVGKGNPDWNNSAPHGAGRLMSRTAARAAIRLEDFKSTMVDVYSSSVGESTLDEAPDAYKPAEEILAHIKPTVDVIHLVKPVYNFKAH